MAKKMMRWEAVSKMVTSFDEAQRRRAAGLERMVENSEEQPAIPKTAPRTSKSRKRRNVGAAVRVGIQRAAGRRAGPKLI